MTKTKNETHGKSNTPEYRAWINMITRCENPKTPEFHNYGGRGVCVAKKWRDSFTEFFLDVGPRPGPEHSLDRIDVHGNYEPSNCRWATKRQQVRNTTVNRIVEFNGRSMTLIEAAECSGFKYNTVLYRLKRGWSLRDALTRAHQRGVRP